MKIITRNLKLSRLALLFLITLCIGCVEFGKDGETSTFGGGSAAAGPGWIGDDDDDEQSDNNGSSDADEDEDDQNDANSDDDPDDPECQDVTFSGSTWFGEDDAAGDTEICSYPVLTLLSNGATLEEDEVAEYELKIEVEGKGVMITSLSFRVTVTDGPEDWLDTFDTDGPESTLTGVSADPTRSFWAYNGQAHYDFSAGGEFAWFGNDHNMPGFELDHDEDETVTFRFDPDGEMPEDVEVEIELYRVSWLSLDDNLIVSLQSGYGQDNDHLVGLGTDDLAATYTFEVDSASGDDDDDDDTPDDENMNDFSFTYNPPGSSTDVDIYVTVILPNGSWAFNDLAYSANNVDSVYIDKNDVPAFEDLPEDAEVIVNAENDGGWPSGTHGCAGSSLNGGWTGYWPNTSGTQFWPISNGGSGCDAYAKAGSTSNPGFSYSPF